MLPPLCLIISLECVFAVNYLITDEEPQEWTDYRLAGNHQDTTQSFYSYMTTDIDGLPHNLSQHAGKVSLVVNVASQCGYTDQHYIDLVQLHHQLAPQGFFTVLAFPCNQFGQQEPWSESAIKKYVSEQYKVNFPLFSKINVTGHNVASVWHHLMDQSGQRPSWNFWKYLVNWEGHVLHAWGPWVSVPSVRPIIDQAVRQAVRMSRKKAGEL